MSLTLATPPADDGSRRRRARVILITAFVMASAIGSESRTDPYESAPPYLFPVQPTAVIRALITTGQHVEHGSGRDSLRFVGSPDGMAFFRPDDETALLYVNHELEGFRSDSVGNRPSGARITSLYLDTTDPGNISVRAGGYTIDHIYDVVFADSLNGDVYAEVASPGPIHKSCSSTLSTVLDGFTDNLYTFGEEVPNPDGFDGMGGLCWVVIYNTAYTLPRMGHGSWENLVLVPNSGNLTTAFPMDDPRATGDNKNAQLYMYVGTKIPGSPDIVARNGLSNGLLYVMRSTDPLLVDEDTFTAKGTSIPVEWVQMDYSVDDAELDAASRDSASFNFFRLEDGEYDDYDTGVLYFISTGHPDETNEFGRLYRYNFDPFAPLNGGTLTILLDGTEGMTGPDNIDINRFGEILINEDPNHDLGTLGLTRDSSVWIYDTVVDTLIRVAEMDRANAIAHALAAHPGNVNNPEEDFPGGWESSGALDAEGLFGPGSWLLNVQAHSLDIHPNNITIQGGQVLRLTYQSPFRSYPPPSFGTAR